MPKSLVAIALSTGLAACQSGASQVPSARISVGVIDSLEVTQRFGGASGSADIDDYSNVQFDFGLITLGEDGLPSTRASVELGVTSFGGAGLDVDATEIAVGGRFYGGALGETTRPIQPFGLAQVLFTLAEVQGEDLGTQVGGRIGGGLQFPISDQVFFDVIADYTIPFVAGQVDFVGLGTLETEYSGLAVRFGLGFTF